MGDVELIIGVFSSLGIGAYKERTINYYLGNPKTSIWRITFQSAKHSKLKVEMVRLYGMREANV